MGMMQPQAGTLVLVRNLLDAGASIMSGRRIQTQLESLNLDLPDILYLIRTASVVSDDFSNQPNVLRISGATLDGILIGAAIRYDVERGSVKVLKVWRA